MSAYDFPSPLRGRVPAGRERVGAGNAGHPAYTSPLPNPSPLKGEGLESKESLA